MEDGPNFCGLLRISVLYGPIVSIKVSVWIIALWYDIFIECILSMDSIIAFGWANEHSYLFFEIEARRWKEKLPDVHGVKELSTFYW